MLFLFWATNLPNKWHEVALTKARKLNALNEHQLPVVRVKEGAPEDLRRILAIPLGEE